MPLSAQLGLQVLAWRRQEMPPSLGSCPRVRLILSYSKTTPIPKGTLYFSLQCGAHIYASF